MGNSSSSLNASLIKACQQGEIEKVKHLLGLGAKVNCSDDNKSTPLMWACACGRTSVVQFLIELKNARITDVDSDGYTCLHWAVIEKHPTVVKYLLTRCKSASFVVNENTNENEIAGDDEIKSDVSNNENVVNKKRSSILLLLNVDCKNVQGDTPLHKAIYYSQKKIAQLLINAGANLNEYNNRQETPLDKARRNDIKLWLKSIGAKANVKQNYEIEGDHKLVEH